jgi:hypothetical protein
LLVSFMIWFVFEEFSLDLSRPLEQIGHHLNET